MEALQEMIFNKESDIDLFIYGDAKGFRKAEIEKTTKREIQLLNTVTLRCSINGLSPR